MATRQPPMNNQVFRVHHIREYQDTPSVAIHEYEGPYAGIGAANARKTSAESDARSSRGPYGGRQHDVVSVVEVIRGEWEAFE